MNEILQFFTVYAPLGLIGSFVAIGYLFMTMKPKSECHIGMAGVEQRIDNASSQRTWMMDVLFKLACDRGIETPPPPRDGDNV